MYKMEVASESENGKPIQKSFKSAFFVMASRGQLVGCTKKLMGKHFLADLSKL